MDTRESSPLLMDAIKQGLTCFDVPFTDLGLQTTPQVHYRVAKNRNSIDDFTDAFIEFA